MKNKEKGTSLGIHVQFYLHNERIQMELQIASKLHFYKFGL